MMTGGSPSFQRRAATSRSPPRAAARRSPRTRRRPAEPHRVQRQRPRHQPGPSAATNEYGHPGSPARRSCRARAHGRTASRLVPASGLSQLQTSTASRSGRPASSGSPASERRSRANSTRPSFSPSYSPPWPRPNSGTSDSRARSVTGRSSHSTASQARTAHQPAALNTVQLLPNPASTRRAPPAPAPPLAAPHQDMRACIHGRFLSPLRMCGNTQHEGTAAPAK